MTHPEWPGSDTAAEEYPPTTYVPPQLDWYRNGPARSRRSSRRAVLWAVVAVVLVAAGIGGWVLYGSGSTSGRPSAAHRPAVAPTSSAPHFPASSTPPSPAALGTLLAQIALHDSDLRPGYTLRLMADGNRVAGQVTLDNCGYRFTTEAHRVARRQYEIHNPAGAEVGIGNELVAYDSAADASLALSQWYRAAAHCPRTAVRSTVAGVPPLTERVTRNQRNAPGLPNANVVTVETESPRGEPTVYLVAIIQVRGRVLDAVYLDDTRPFTSTELAAAIRLAAVTGQRLAVNAA